MLRACSPLVHPSLPSSTNPSILLKLSFIYPSIEEHLSIHPTLNHQLSLTLYSLTTPLYTSWNSSAFALSIWNCWCKKSHQFPIQQLSNNTPKKGTGFPSSEWVWGSILVHQVSILIHSINHPPWAKHGIIIFYFLWLWYLNREPMSPRCFSLEPCNYWL